MPTVIIAPQLFGALGDLTAKVAIGEFLPFCTPRSPAFLHQPQTHDILQQPNRLTDPALIGKL